LDFGEHGGFGPGKIALLETIDRLGSIAAAGREMDISYRRAWLMVESVNAMFGRMVVERMRGGTGGGGRAVLTPLGHTIVTQYRQMEREAEAIAHKRLQALQRALPATPRANP
jgi:molybdate transport system regulatory protein